MDRQFARAIRAYLTLAEHREASDDPGYPGAQNFGHERGDKLGAPSRGEDGDVQEGGQYAHVFRMIEQHSLFDTVQARECDEMGCSRWNIRVCVSACFADCNGDSLLLRALWFNSFWSGLVPLLSWNGLRNASGEGLRVSSRGGGSLVGDGVQTLLVASLSGPKVYQCTEIFG